MGYSGSLAKPSKGDVFAPNGLALATSI